jgi:hypothetical protein
MSVLLLSRVFVVEISVMAQVLVAVSCLLLLLVVLMLVCVICLRIVLALQLLVLLMVMLLQELTHLANVLHHLLHASVSVKEMDLMEHVMVDEHVEQQVHLQF